MAPSVVRRVFLLSAVFLAFAPAMLAPSPAAAQQPITGLVPISPQPNADELTPGLAVRYYFAKWDFMWEMERSVRRQEGVQGKPIPVIDTFYEGYDHNVLTADRTQSVGALMSGLIHFDTPGVYHLSMWSNDGVRLEIGGKFIYEDPDKHSNRLSPNIPVEITEPGWYPLNLNYFQKKGTWALDLLWFKPGEAPEGDAPVVPAEAYAHLPGTPHIFVPAPES